MRNNLHDYLEEKALIVLGRLVDVMDNESVLLVDEMVLPNRVVESQRVQLDILMMTFTGVERTTRQWESLIDVAGL